MSFNSIYGHEKQINVLRNAMAAKRVPHAYLFYGMEGIGKRTVAKVFAKALNCEGLKTGRDACDECPSCFKTDRGNHADVITIKAEGQFIRIKEIRDLQEQMKFRPFERGKRIVIMEDSDRMNNVSANALLKTLEEPSASNILILVTSRPHQLPVTILSRCQHLRFNPLQKETVASFLQDTLSLDQESSYLIASSSGGSIGKALEMYDESYLKMREEIFDTLLGAQKRGDFFALMSFIDDFGQERKEITKKLGILMTGYRDALVYKETGKSDILINQDRLDTIKSIAENMSGQDILNNIRTVGRTSDAIDQNVNKQLTLEVMMFRLGMYKAMM